MPEVYIYALIDPRNDSLRYVGKTNDLARRLCQHILDAEKKQRTHKASWIRALLKLDLRPEIRILEACTDSTWKERERWWIEHLKSDGQPLTNMTDGGDGIVGYVYSLADRKRMSENAKRDGRKPPNTPESHAKIAAQNRGRKRPQEERDRISAARTEMKFTDSHRKRLSDVKTALFQSERGQDLAKQISRSYAGLTDEQAIEVWRLAGSGLVSQREIAQSFGISQSVVSEIKHGKKYKHVTFPTNDER